MKAAGMRITQPRIAIFEVLLSQTKPASVEQIHANIDKISCDLVTVYRCMGAFEEIGLVRRAFFHNGTALYELNMGEPSRYHVVCKETQQVNEIDQVIAHELRVAIERVQQKLRELGFDEIEHIVEFFGVFPHQQQAALSRR
ncbi:MAG: hypothetical protein RL077_5029 [Verrucomicrobiota bacterium]